jgi:hypothetical protein
VATAQTWPFVEIFAYKRYFYLEAQSFTLDGHPELFVWLWFLGNFFIKLLSSSVCSGPVYCI